MVKDDKEKQRVLLHKQYFGYEDSSDIDRDVSEAVEQITDEEPEFGGTITIMVIYNSEGE